jgi:hypothetical protein
MTYQINEKHLTNVREYFVGVDKIAIYCYNNRFLLHVFTNNLLNYLSNWTSKTRKMLCLRVFDPPRLEACDNIN